MKANRMKNAARKQIQPNRKDVKSTAADNDRIYEKSLQSHPDEDGGFLFNYGWIFSHSFMFVWCPSWAACVTYNILLCWLAIKIIRAIYSARSESSLPICSSFQISLQGVMMTFSVVTIAVKCQ